MGDDSKPSVAVLLTCHNRCATTVEALGALRGAAGDHITLHTTLVDDGSTDGTAEAVEREFPEVHRIRGSGDLYWNGGMRLAWQSAIKFNPDFFLWLNDDLSLEPQSIDRLLELWRVRSGAVGKRLIVIGKTISPTTGETTYGGYWRASRLSKLRFRHRRGDDPDSCDTMNGNCVLIPRIAQQEIGINSPYFTHSMGDIDYGLRARRAGYTLVEHQTPVGFQERNEKWAKSVSRMGLDNWRFILLNPKGVRPIEWFHFCRLHGGVVWPLNFFGKYIRLIFSSSGSEGRVY